MRITLDALLVLDAIDRTGSFAAAAGELFRVPSAVSYTIQKLERDLQVTLFDRSGHRARLTKAGGLLLRDGRQLLQLARDAERRVIAAGAGWESRLTIGIADVVSTRGIVPLLRAFYEQPGHESTRLHVRIEGHRPCLEALSAGRSDLVIGALESIPLGNGFQVQPLVQVRFTLVMSAAHPLAAADEPVSDAMCASHRQVRRADWPLDEQTRPAAEVIVVNDYSSQVDMIRHGIGIGYLPAHIARDEVRDGRMIAKSVEHAPTLLVSAAWRVHEKGQWLMWFIDRLRDESLRAQLGSEMM